VPSVPGQIGGSYFGSVMITSPITLTIQVLNLNLWNDGGTLTGTVNSSEASLYPDGLSLNGFAPEDDNFYLTSQPFTTTIARQAVTQIFTLTGHMEEGGDILRAVYTATIANLLPAPILVQGRFSGSRPGAVGSQRLMVEAGAWAVPLGASTTIMATLYDETMALITETRTITFTADLGTVVPAVADTVDGEAAVTFTAGQTPGQAMIVATTGEITGTVRIQVGESGSIQPVADFTASPTSGPAPLTVVFTNTSTGDYTQVRWDFGDGQGYAGTLGPVYTRTLLLPSHVYTATGSYTVTLSVSDGVITSTLTRPNYIRVTGEAIYLPLILRNSQ
jgi:hypothetical protein